MQPCNKFLGWALLLVLLSAVPALAHKVNLFAYLERGTVLCESYFPDGKPVIEGKVLVYDGGKQLLLEGRTDQQGRFSFAVPKVDDLEIVIEAGMGHRNRFKLKRSEVEAGR